MASDPDAASRDPACDETEAEPMVAVYRHDVHKLFGRRHTAAQAEYRSVRVNETVPLGADQDAALLSRPAGELEQTVANHTSPYRLSLVTGTAAVESRRIVAASDGGFAALIEPADPAALHASWLTSAVAAAYNESVHYPYTSLKYHVLLAGALLSAYRAGYAFDDLYVVARPGEAAARADVSAAAARDSPVVTLFETVLWSPAVTVDVTPQPGERPAARLGGSPARSFAAVWSRLPAHPVRGEADRFEMVVDAQLRRIQSWSAALQFVEAVAAGAVGGRRADWPHRRDGAGTGGGHGTGDGDGATATERGGRARPGRRGAGGAHGITDDDGSDAGAGRDATGADASETPGGRVSGRGRAVSAAGVGSDEPGGTAGSAAGTRSGCADEQGSSGNEPGSGGGANG